jgi:hypothetical protein
LALLFSVLQHDPIKVQKGSWRAKAGWFKLRAAPLVRRQGGSVPLHEYRQILRRKDAHTFDVQGCTLHFWVMGGYVKSGPVFFRLKYQELLEHGIKFYRP